MQDLLRKTWGEWVTSAREEAEKKRLLNMESEHRQVGDSNNEKLYTVSMPVKPRTVQSKTVDYISLLSPAVVANCRSLLRVRRLSGFASASLAPLGAERFALQVVDYLIRMRERSFVTPAYGDRGCRM